MLSIVMPAYNESLSIGQTIAETEGILQQTVFAESYEIIVVDDHSSDKTYETVAALNRPRVRVIRLSQRKGSHTAIRAGMAAAQGEAILCMSADGQDNPNVIPQMVDKWQDGVQIVWALRRNASRTNEPFFYRLFALAFYRILKAMTQMDEYGVDLSRADFYLLDRRVADSILACQESHTSLFGLIAWSGFRQEGIDYDRRNRLEGKSKWNFSSRWNLAKDWIIAFSAIPLRAMIWLGSGIGIMGLLYACVIMFLYLFFGQQIAGWSSLMVATVMLGGINIAMLGILGEYLWHTLDEARRRPLFFIESDSQESKKRL